MVIFQIVPIFLELILVCLVIGFNYPWYFFVIVLAALAAYLLDTYIMTEWRAKYFKKMNIKDQAY